MKIDYTHINMIAVNSICGCLGCRSFICCSRVVLLFGFNPLDSLLHGQIGKGGDQFVSKPKCIHPMRCDGLRYGYATR